MFRPIDRYKRQLYLESKNNPERFGYLKYFHRWNYFENKSIFGKHIDDRFFLTHYAHERNKNRKLERILTKTYEFIYEYMDYQYYSPILAKDKELKLHLGTTKLFMQAYETFSSGPGHYELVHYELILTDPELVSIFILTVTGE